ncbi:hypothetical protein ACNQFZ_06515 [Schinkia sp. CFF1]
MDIASFFTGAFITAFAYAMFSSDRDSEDDVFEDEESDGSTGRYVTLSCQTCRKLKKHKEIEHNLYQCTKCKRHIDLR